MKNSIKLAVVSTLLLFLSCTKITNTPIDLTNIRAIVVSEGQFGYGTGSLTALSHSKNVTQDIFRVVNNRPLGDIPQSLTQIGDKYYIPVNNSRKVEVVDATTFESIETMEIDFNVIPMYLVHLGADSVIVSDQSSSAIPNRPASASLFILDINHGTDREIIRRRVPVGSPTFQMKVVGGKLFVASTSLLVYDINNINEDAVREVRNGVGQSFGVSNFSKLCVDKNGDLWTLTPTSIVCIDTTTETIKKEIKVEGVDSRWGNMDIDKAGENIYFNSKNLIYTVNVDNPVAPTKPIITHDNNDKSWTTYALGVSKENTICIVRVLYGSLTRGRVFEYNTRGEIVNRYMDSDGKEQSYFRAGIFPHFIHFL